MTPPDFDAMAAEWLWANGLGEKRSVWSHEKDRAALGQFLRSVHAQGREAGIREAADECIEEQRTMAMLLQRDADIAAGSCARRILALLPSVKP